MYVVRDRGMEAEREVEVYDVLALPRPAQLLRSDSD